MKKLTKIALAVLAVSLIANVAFAATISSLTNQSFVQNQNPDILSDITVTEATKGKVKITIPEELKMIFDAKKTISELSLYGSAVDNKRVLSKPSISFEGKDKILVIPVEQDFINDEKLIIKNAYVKGFNQSGVVSKNLILTLNDGTTQYLDNATKYISSSSLEDTQSPEPPTNMKVQDSGEAVQLTWTDPTDLDLSVVQILRGKNNFPVDGTPYNSIGPTVQKFIDTDVKKGDTVKYILRATDGRNFSTITQEISFVVGSTPAAVPVEPEEAVVEEPPVDATLEDAEPATEIKEEIVEEDCGNFTDVKPSHKLCVAIGFVQEKGIFSGYSDGTFKPQQKINRAELLKVIFTTFQKEPADSSALTFKDVDNKAWYAPYIAVAKSLGIVAGYPDGTFKPEQTVSKIEAYKILLKAAEVPLKDEIAAPPYSDTPISESTNWYLPYAFYALEMSLETGENFYPNKEMTRGQVAELIYKFKTIEIVNT